MSLNTEYKELLYLGDSGKGKQISVIISPALLIDIDRVCREHRFSRGDLLSVCFLRLFPLHKEKKKEKAPPKKEPPVYDDCANAAFDQSLKNNEEEEYIF